MFTVTKIEKHERSAPRYGKFGMSSTWRQFNAKPRIYVWTEGETVLENFGNRAARPSTLYRKYALPAVREKFGIPANVKISWSRTAGCSCGCSPGFIVHSKDVLFRCDVHVTISADAPKTTDPELAANRMGQLVMQLEKEAM